MQAANRVAKNTGILYAKMAITVLISLYTTRLVLNTLGSNDFGLYNVVGGAIAMLGFLNASMAAATQRFMSFAQGTGDFLKINKIFNMSVLLHLMIAGIVFIVLEIAGYFFFHGILTIEPSRLHTARLIYQLMIFSTMFSVMSVPYDALLNAHENMLFYSVLGIIESVIKLAIALLIMKLNADKLLYYGALMFLLSITLLIINRIYCHTKYPEAKINLKANYEKTLLKEMSGFAGWNILGSSTGMIAGYGSGIILNHFFGTVLNAVSGITGQLNGQLLAFSNTMLKALNPMITKSEGSGNRELMLGASLTGCKLSFLLYAFFATPFILETPFILKIWLKEVPEWTVIFCRLSLIRVMIEQLTISLGTSISAVGKIKEINIFRSVLLIVEVTLVLFAFSLGAQPTAMVLISIFSVIISGILFVQQTVKYCNLKYELFLKNILFNVTVVTMLTITVSSVPIFFMNVSYIRLIIVILLTSLSFTVLIYTFSLTASEKTFVLNLVKEVRNKIKKIV